MECSTRPEEESGEEGSGRSPSSVQPPRRHAALLAAPYSIPRALAVSPRLGGLPVTPELAAVSLGMYFLSQPSYFLSHPSYFLSHPS